MNELEEFTSVGRPNAPYRCMAYGPSGVGKSTFFSHCEGVYFLPTEEGVNEIKVAQYKSRITSMTLLYEIIGKLRDKQHPYTSVCLDTVKDTEQLIIEQIEERLRKSTKKDAPKSIQEMNDDYGAGYQAIASEWKNLLKAFDELRYKRNINIFLTGHTKKEKIVNLEGKDYEKITLDLIGQASSKVITAWCDYVLYMRQDVSFATESKHKTLSMKGSLSIYTRGTPTYTAKTRGDVTWPERLPLDWEVFDKLRSYVTTHGKNLSHYLRGWFAELKPTIPTDENRREKADKAFHEFLGSGQWHLAIMICEQAEAEKNG